MRLELICREADACSRYFYKQVNNKNGEVNLETIFNCRSQNSVLSERIDHLVQANAQLMEEHRQISQELEQVNQNHQIALKNLESLEGIQIQFNRLVLHGFYHIKQL